MAGVDQGQRFCQLNMTLIRPSHGLTASRPPPPHQPQGSPTRPVSLFRPERGYLAPVLSNCFHSLRQSRKPTGSSPATREHGFLWVPALGITIGLWSLPASTPSAWAPARDILSCQHIAYAPKQSSLLLMPDPNTRAYSTIQAQVQHMHTPSLLHQQARSTTLYLTPTTQLWTFVPEHLESCVEVWELRNQGAVGVHLSYLAT